MIAYMYILLCSNGCYYVGSTTDLSARMIEHQDGIGAHFTSKHLPVKLIFYEEFPRIEEAFLREKQIQGWSLKKNESLIHQHILLFLSLSINYTQFNNQKSR